MPQRHPVTLFALATLAPLPLLGLGAWLGGAWTLLPLAYMTVLAALLDRLAMPAAPDAPAQAEFPAADRLSVALALGHFAALALGIAAVAGATGLSGWERAALFAGFGLFLGQIGNANAHELIHRPGRGLRWLGTLVYVSLLFGHHASAHPQVHHRFVATPDDPNTARSGTSFYRFAIRAWTGSFRAGLRLESRRLARRGLPAWRHPYVAYVAGAVAMLALSAVSLGLPGLLAHLGLAGYATAQLLLSDYVQHYGLRRARLPDGRYAPVAPCHSWNAPHWFSGALLLNAPRHSDHHAHPSRKYPALRLPPETTAPTLPYGLPVMACIALIPPLWRRLMDPRAARWRQDAADNATVAGKAGAALAE